MGHREKQGRRKRDHQRDLLICEKNGTLITRNRLVASSTRPVFPFREVIWLDGGKSKLAASRAVNAASFFPAAPPLPSGGQRKRKLQKVTKLLAKWLAPFFLRLLYVFFCSYINVQ